MLYVLHFENISNIMNNTITRLNLKNRLQLKFFRCFSQSVEPKINIPKRIPRSPTDILQALASTIKRDQTAAHYKYHDDPYLIPVSNTGKRTFAMAQEAGRKAAHWVRREHADLFNHQVAEPPIKMFTPEVVYNETSDVNEEILRGIIRDANVPGAITVYNLCEKKKLPLARETVQDLLELLCFYNCEEQLSEEFIEEKWFKAGAKSDRPRKSWRDGGLAEQVFRSVENPGTREYCAIIQGMAKYYQVDGAWSFFDEANQKKIQLNTAAYNSLIRVVHFRKEGFDMRWSLVQDLLMTMAKQELKPDIGTLNAILDALSNMPGYKQTRNLILQTLAEFKQLGIEPCLGSWYYILITYCRERSKTSYILHDIINYIEGKEFKIMDMKDTYFFVTAMDISRNHLNDKDLSYRVHRLLQTGNNYDLIGDSYKESIYYRHQFALLCNTEPLDTFMEYYKKMVPNIYIPEPSIMLEVLKAVEIHAAIEHVPKLWSDIVSFDHTDRENLLVMVLNIMVSHEPPPDSDLHQNFATIAWNIWSKVEQQPPERIRKLNFTAAMVTDIMQLLLRVDDFQKAVIVMNKIQNEAHMIVGIPGIDILRQFIEHCVKWKAPSLALNCIQYCSENGFEETASLARYVNKSFTLSEIHFSKLSSLVGKAELESSTT